MLPAAQFTQPRTRPGKRKIVLTTFGSLGDLHPYLAIALGLRERGYEAVLATSTCYRRKVEGMGLGFRPVRPDSDWVNDPAVMRRVMGLRRGTERLVREILLPALRESYQDTLAAAHGAALLVSFPLAFATRLVAERTGIPWASTMIAPLGFFSTYDVPVLPAVPILSRLLHGLGPAFWGPLSRFLKWGTRSWAEPWDRLRAEIGLPPAPEGNPLVDGHSPSLVLALFSKLLADRQPDWPPQTVVTGFPFLDQESGAGLPAALARFLDAGPPPLVFTLGSSAVRDAGSFYEHSAAAAQRLGRRAVLLVGRATGNRPAELPEGVVASDYAPFAELFPRAAAVVHQGGIGTTGRALQAGCPMLVMPFTHDQPDNAERVRRLGVARTISRRRYTPARAAAELGSLLEDPAYARRATEVGEQVRQEDGVAAACDALEGFLHGTARRPEAVSA
jgi:UDP:flavonoid glycosyltransferase YjiC (YdhE family)